MRVRVTDSGGNPVGGGVAPGIYTPCQAAGITTGGCDGLPADPPVMSNQIWIYNGTSYQTWSDQFFAGNLKYFQSFWVKVYAAVAANNYTVELLIPAEMSSHPNFGLLDAPSLSEPANPVAASTHNQVEPASGIRLATAPRPWLLTWLDWLIAPAASDEVESDFGPAQHPGTHPAEHPARQQPQALTPATAAQGKATAKTKTLRRPNAQGLDPRREWYVRLLVDEPATGYQDHNSVLGQLLNAQNGFDPRDLSELPPFGKPYLTLVFPHPEWGPQAGDYASDFRRARKLNAKGRPVSGLPAADWSFTIRVDRPGTPVILRWEGDPAVLRNSQLIDPNRRRPVKLQSYPNGYPITLTNGSRNFIWRYKDQIGLLP